jgi:hypothetical protein
MGHSQPKNPVHCDNATAVGIANNTVKQQHSCFIKMRFFGVSDKFAQDMYTLSWHPGREILADYQSKHHLGAHTQLFVHGISDGKFSTFSPKGQRTQRSERVCWNPK